MLDQLNQAPVQTLPELNGYRIVKLIGEGGYGFVYAAEQVSTGQRVAVKMLKLDPELDEQKRNYQIARFERESRLCAELNHPHIVGLLDKGITSDNIPFAIFEFIEGDTLKDLIVQRGGLSALETGELMGQVLDALAAAHRKGIVHRDLKPHNIMVTRSGSQPHVKVLDFGIGAFTREFQTNDYKSLTLTREVMGTPAYSAPEQLRGEPATVKSDLYAWGLVTIECLTGMPVMKGDSVAEVFQQQLNQANVPLPPAIAGHSVAEILRRTLHKNARLRTGDAAVLYQDFKRINFSTLVGQIQPQVPVPGAPDDVTAANPLAWQDLRSERRQITVLAVKLSLDVSEAKEMDMETLDAILKDQLNQLKDTGVRFGGYVAGSLGDHLVFHFGYPTVSDNDARRAGRTALEMISGVRKRSALLYAQYGIQLEIRVAIHSGTVLSKPNQTPTGTVPNMAFDLLYRTSPGSILVTDPAKKLLDPYLEFESGTEQHFPNHSEPLDTHFITGERQTEALSFLRPWSANREMVGRDMEKDQLLREWAAVKSGEQKAVVVHGQAGIGKSKMIYEVKKQIRSDGHLFREARCLTEHQNNALFPFLDLLRNHWGIAGMQHEGEMFQVLENELRNAGADLERGLPVLCFWLNISLKGDYQLPQVTPDIQKQILFELLRKALEALGQGNPFMLVLEDLHWLDPTGEEFVRYLLATPFETPCLFLMTTRPVYIPDWQHPHLAYLALHPLSETSTEIFVQNVLDGKDIEARALQYIEERADGIPLYLEELTRMLVEEGYLTEVDHQYQFTEETDIQAIPRTLQDLLNARLDRLGLAKESAQIAATIGREFDYELLVRASLRDEASVQHDLDALMDADLIFRQRKVSGDSYLFRHALIRDAAYDGMLGGARRGHHLRIAETLKAHFSESIEENPFEVARHLAGGGEYVEGSEYGIKAVEKQVGNSANEEAQKTWIILKSWIDKLDAHVKKIELELKVNNAVTPSLMATQGFGSEEALKVNERNESLVAMLDGVSHELKNEEVNRLQHHVLWTKFNRFHHSGQRLEARQLGKRILDGFIKTPNPKLEIGTLTMIGQAFHADGELDKAESLYDRILILYKEGEYESLGDEYGIEPKSGALFYKCHTRWSLGYPDEAADCAEKAIDFSEEVGHMPSILLSYTFKALLGHLLDNPQDTIHSTDRFIKKYGDQYQDMWLAHHLKVCREWALGNLDYVLWYIQTIRESGQDYALSWYTTMAADIYTKRGELQNAISVMESTLENSIKTKEKWSLPTNKRILANLLFKRERKVTTRIMNLFEEGLADAKTMGMRWHKMEVLSDYNRVLRDSKHPPKYKSELKNILDELNEGTSTKAYISGTEILSHIK